VIPGDRIIRPLTLNGVEGYWVPPARMQEILKRLADRRLAQELQEAK
jgi:hypothetical protein